MSRLHSNIFRFINAACARRSIIIILVCDMGCATAGLLCCIIARARVYRAAGKCIPSRAVFFFIFDNRGEQTARFSETIAMFLLQLCADQPQIVYKSYDLEQPISCVNIKIVLKKSYVRVSPGESMYRFKNKTLILVTLIIFLFLSSFLRKYRSEEMGQRQFK